jgi:hypothetical protein
VLEKSQRLLGSDSWVTALMLVERGMRLQARGLWGQSIESRRQLLDLTRQRYGVQHHLPEEIRTKSIAMARWQAVHLAESRTRPIDQEWLPE